MRYGTSWSVVGLLLFTWLAGGCSSDGGGDTEYRLKKIQYSNVNEVEYFYQDDRISKRIWSYVNGQSPDEEFFIYDSDGKLDKIGPDPTSKAESQIFVYLGEQITGVNFYDSGENHVADSSYTYNGDGVLISESTQSVGGSTDGTYEYDANGRLIKVTYNHGAGPEVSTYTYVSATSKELQSVENDHAIHTFEYRDGRIYKEYIDFGKDGTIDNTKTYTWEAGSCSMDAWERIQPEMMARGLYCP